jgi:choice-of-anchor A domain-containing protein
MEWIMVLSRLRVSVVAVAAGLSIGPVASADSLYGYNAVVTDQYRTSNHVEGAAFGKNVYTFNSPVFTGGLSVSGSLTSDGTYISINGSHLTTTSSLGSFHVNYNGGSTAVVDPTLPAQMTALAGEIAADSAGYAAMASNGSVTLGGSTLSFTNPANATGQLVFTVDLTANPSWFSTSNLQFKFDLGVADSAVVNVIGGGNLSPNQGSFNPQSTTLAS